MDGYTQSQQVLDREKRIMGRDVVAGLFGRVDHHHFATFLSVLVELTQKDVDILPLDLL